MNFTNDNIWRVRFWYQTQICNSRTYRVAFEIATKNLLKILTFSCCKGAAYILLVCLDFPSWGQSLMSFSEITTATSGNTSMANTVKSREYALAVCTEKGQFWWVYIRGGAYIQGGVWGGGDIREEKYFNLQSAELTFLSFFQYKAHNVAFFTSCKMWNMFKVNNIDTGILT